MSFSCDKTYTTREKLRNPSVGSDAREDFTAATGRFFSAAFSPRSGPPSIYSLNESYRALMTRVVLFLFAPVRGIISRRDCRRRFIAKRRFANRRKRTKIKQTCANIARATFERNFNESRRFFPNAIATQNESHTASVLRQSSRVTRRN